MRSLLPALLILVVCWGASAETAEIEAALPKIGKVSFSAEFELDTSALLTAVNLPLGTAFEPQMIEAAKKGLTAYFYSIDQYYIQIPNPALVPLEDGSLSLEFRFVRLLDSSECYIRYTGLRYFSASKLHQMVFSSEEKSYPLSELPKIMQNVLHTYNNRGYLFTKVELDSLVIGEKLLAYIKIEEGKQITPQKYLFEGNKISRESSLLKSSGLSRQRVITPEVLEQAEQNIRSKSYIRDCAIIPLDSESILIQIEEGKMTFFEGMLGMTEANGKRQLSGLVRIDFLNLWGSDRAIKLYWRQIPTKLSELTLGYHESGHPDVPIAADFALNRSTQDSTWIKSSWGADIFYQSLYQRVGIGGQMVSILPGTGFSAISRNQSSSLGAFWRYKRLSGDRFPTGGTQVDIRYDYIFESKRQYTSLKTDTKNYMQISSRWIGFLGTHVRNYDTTQIESYNLFTMGGYGSLRGFREDEFRSRRLAWANAEIQYMLDLNSMFYGFYDHGLTEIEPNKLKMDNFGIGIGVKLGTKLGIMSIEYGLGYRDNRFSDIGLGMIHMGLDVAI